MLSYLDFFCGGIQLKYSFVSIEAKDEELGKIMKLPSVYELGIVMYELFKTHSDFCSPRIKRIISS